MAKTYIGVNGTAREVSKIYVGVNGLARQVKKAYVGDENGLARLVYQYGSRRELPEWCLPTGIAASDVLAVYQFTGVDTLAEACQDLSGNGYDLSVVGSGITQDSATGVTIPADLTCGLTNANLINKYADVINIAYKFTIDKSLGGCRGGVVFNQGSTSSETAAYYMLAICQANASHSVVTRTRGGTYLCWNSSVLANTGVMQVRFTTSTVAYINGTKKASYVSTATTPTFGSGNTSIIRNIKSGTTTVRPFSLSALVIYKNDNLTNGLTDAQMVTLYNNMVNL